MTQYLSLSDPMYTKIEDAVRQTYSNSCIVWIERVINPELEEKHDIYKASFDKPNVKQLFHGTSEEICRKIVSTGFDPTFNKVSAHGKGVYFSTRAAYSKEYSRMRMSRKADLAYMLVCDVVLGKVGEGRASTVIPKEYDSVTDSLHNPDMYIIDKPYAAIPRYLVVFYPYAK